MTRRIASMPAEPPAIVLMMSNGDCSGDAWSYCVRVSGSDPFAYGCREAVTWDAKQNDSTTRSIDGLGNAR